MQKWNILDSKAAIQSLVLLKKNLLKNAHSAETIEHMLLECSQWQAPQADILAQYINIYRAQVATKSPVLPTSIPMRLFDKFVGEELKLPSTRIRKDPTVLCVKTTLATAKFLNAIALPRYLILKIIMLVPIPQNQCPPVFCTFVMSNVPGVIPSAAAGVPLIPTKRNRLEYSTVAKTGYIDPATKNDYNFNFPSKNSQNSQKNDKNIKNQKKNDKFQQHNKNN
ncbi:hypothetical protein BB561_006208, partial [Smittium simulii]